MCSTQNIQRKKKSHIKKVIVTSFQLAFEKSEREHEAINHICIRRSKRRKMMNLVEIKFE